MYDIFVSYSHLDIEKMKELIDLLKQNGFSVWVDQDIRGGTNYDTEIENQLNLCKCALVLWSKNSIDSDWVMNEARRAKNQKKIIPILLDDVQIPIEFERLQYINFVNWTVSNSNKEFIKLLESIKRFIPTKIKLDKNQPPELAYPIYSLNEKEKNTMQRLLIKYSSWLSEQRKDEIINNYIKYIESGKLRSHRKQHIEYIQKRNNLIQKPFIEPAWISISTTSSQYGHRLVIGFQTIGCEYRRKNNIGCFHCGFYAGAMPPPKFQLISSLKSQFRKGLKFAKELFWKIDVIEFLSDGSFLNDNELPEDIKKNIFHSISKMPNIKKVLVESTPNKVFDERKEVIQRLKGLREDQVLEIGIGLETSDDFIRQACFNKGYTIEEFERAITHLNSLDKPLKKRVNVVAYVFVKPPFLNEKESIEDVLRTIKYLYKLNCKSDVKIIPKLEPAIISNGTLLSLLWEEDKYAPLNYWMILEILTRIYFDNEMSEILNQIRIGTRLDMDDSLKIPGIYREDGRFNQYDFIIYRAIQNFNQSKDIYLLFSIIKTIYKAQKSDMFFHSQSLRKWIDSSGISGSSSIVNFVNSKSFKKYEKEYELTRNKDISYLEQIIELLDMISTQENISLFVKNITKLKNHLSDVTSDDSKKDISIFTKTDNLPIFIDLLNKIIDRSQHESFLPHLFMLKKRLNDIIHEEILSRDIIDQEVFFTSKLFKLLDIVEGYTEDTFFLEFAQKCKKEYKEINSIVDENNLKLKIQKEIQKVLLTQFEFLEVYINDIYVETKGPEMLRISMNISDLILQKTYELWVGIPTNH